jgi:hypothetical protein
VKTNVRGVQLASKRHGVLEAADRLANGHSHARIANWRDELHLTVGRMKADNEHASPALWDPKVQGVKHDRFDLLESCVSEALQDLAERVGVRPVA